MDTYPMTSALLPWVIVPLCVVIAFSDFTARRVPNAWLLIALALGMILFCVEWMNGRTEPTWQPLLGFLTGLLVLLPFYVAHWMGAGDVKLFATLGFLLGAKALLPIWIIASLLAGMHAAYVLLSNYRLRHAMHGANDSNDLQALLPAKTRHGTPYAAFLSAGALITLFNPLLTHW
jgi:prepilin peptidase CpaA